MNHFLFSVVVLYPGCVLPQILEQTYRYYRKWAKRQNSLLENRHRKKNYQKRVQSIGVTVCIQEFFLSGSAHKMPNPPKKPMLGKISEIIQYAKNFCAVLTTSSMLASREHHCEFRHTPLPIPCGGVFLHIPVYRALRFRLCYRLCFRLC